MKKKNLFGLVAIITVVAINVQWLGLVQDGHLFKSANALYQNTVNLDGGGGGFGGGGGGEGYDFLYDPDILDILVVDDVEITLTVPNQQLVVQQS